MERFLDAPMYVPRDAGKDHGPVCGMRAGALCDLSQGMTEGGRRRPRSDSAFMHGFPSRERSSSVKCASSAGKGRSPSELLDAPLRKGRGNTKSPLYKVRKTLHTLNLKFKIFTLYHVVWSLLVTLPDHCDLPQIHCTDSCTCHEKLSTDAYKHNIASLALSEPCMALD
jgi:hypothetical protein